jgi:predicted RNase H-like HicB family nuclease
MPDVKDTIYVEVEYFDGQAEDEDGTPYYVAHNDILHFTTDGESFEELLKNIGEVIALCLEDTDSVVQYGVAPNAKVIIVMPLPEQYAQTA